MKWMKRVTALFLCFLMLSSGPISAFAQTDVSGNDVVVETTAETTQTTEAPTEAATETNSETTEATEETTETTEETTEASEESTEAAESNDVVGCSECGQTEGHAETCSQYVAPIEVVTEITGPQVGDKIWIKSGSYVYKDSEGTQKHQLIGNYEVEIKAIITDDSGVVTAYEFEFITLGIGEIALGWSGFKYVHVENTSVEEPEATAPADENACSCGENAPENLADHADSCPRKQYIKTLFEGKTAEEIYVEWENYDEATQTDLLNMLQKWDSAKYEKLEKLVNETDDSSGLDIIYIKYAGTAANGVSAEISAPEGSFPEGTTVSVTDVTVSSSEVESVIEDNILGIVSVDISFGGAEPLSDVMVSLNVPANKVPTDANKVIIVHMSSSGPEVVGTKHLDTTEEGETITFKTDSFSSYVAVFVNGKYNAQKMSSVLADNDRYQIVTFDVDLFDYDPVKLNTALNNATSDGKGFHLTGYGIANMGSNNGINNSESTHAKQGILQNSLLNGFPVINFLNGDNAGAATGQILFSDSYGVEGKTVYNDIPFEFVYDSQTGYYEYKSSANHAQLNETENRIELYADTLSTENSYVATLDLSTANGTSDFTSITASSSSFKAVISDTNSNGRLDPYVLFTVDNVSASDVGQIYVKAKIPADVGTNAFQLFFTTNKATGWSEDKSFGNTTYSKAIPYASNGDWIEFVIDTSENSNWKDTITAVRVDLFDSNKGALDNGKSYSIEIAEIRLIRKNYDAYATRGGFYPFSEIQDSYPGNNTAFDFDAWGSLFLDDSLSMARASRSIFNPAPSSEALRYEELAFGTVIEFDFYLPVDKTGLDGKPLTYYFNGDDDLWVFVDDQLVLDIGGGHGAVTGSVNFTEGTWNVENAITVTGYDSGANGTYGPKNGTLSGQLYTPGKHTMKIFYLERGGSVSNCFMKFNLPRTPQGSVVVSKEVVEKNNANNSELLAAEFEFQIQIQNNGTGDYQNITPLANADYYVVGSDGTSTSGKTDANGKFTLKSGQEAHFNIDENYNVTVEEKEKKISDHKWVSTTVNNEDGFSLTQLTAVGQEKRFDFVNTYERLYGDLKISKTGISALDHNSEETQSTIYVISGTSNMGETVYLEVVIVGNSHKIIKHIPLGTYTVTEKDDWSWRYEPKSNNHTVTIVGGETVETAFENERTEIYWLSGDSYCENWWGDSGNVIRKEENE